MNKLEVFDLDKEMSKMSMKLEAINDIVKVAYSKYCDGDSLSDYELDHLIRHFTVLENMLWPLGLKFFLARKEISGVLMVLKSFQKERRTV